MTVGYLGTDLCIITDWDERRTISVETSREEPGNDDGFFTNVIAKYIDTLPADAVTIKVSPDGELLSTSCNTDEDDTRVPTYFSRSDYSQEMHTVRRPELTELERLAIQTDLVTYGPDQRMVVFKYYIAPHSFVAIWHEAHCLSRIPAHPHIVSFDSLVVDSAGGGEDKVVGFTTKFIPGGTIRDNVSRVFKLKYLRQLLEVCFLV